MKRAIIEAIKAWLDSTVLPYSSKYGHCVFAGHAQIHGLEAGALHKRLTRIRRQAQHNSNRRTRGNGHSRMHFLIGRERQLYRTLILETQLQKMLCLCQSRGRDA